MSSIQSRFGTKKTSPRPLQANPDGSIYAGHLTTVNCHECNRIMVPRVITYYGQAQKSICPFCGATFMKFPSGLQRLLLRFHNRMLSFAVLKQLIMVTFGFVSLMFMTDWLKLPDRIGLLAFYGAVIFGVTCLAELLFQCIERLAVRLSHESNYYWASLVAIAMVTGYFRNDLIGYIAIFFLIILLRGLVVGLLQFRRIPS